MDTDKIMVSAQLGIVLQNMRGHLDACGIKVLVKTLADTDNALHLTAVSPFVSQTMNMVMVLQSDMRTINVTHEPGNIHYTVDSWEPDSHSLKTLYAMVANYLHVDDELEAILSERAMRHDVECFSDIHRQAVMVYASLVELGEGVTLSSADDREVWIAVCNKDFASISLRDDKGDVRFGFVLGGRVFAHSAPVSLMLAEKQASAVWNILAYHNPLVVQINSQYHGCVRCSHFFERGELVLQADMYDGAATGFWHPHCFPGYRGSKRLVDID